MLDADWSIATSSGFDPWLSAADLYQRHSLWAAGTVIFVEALPYGKRREHAMSTLSGGDIEIDAEAHAR
jgi:hypothetical protein